MPDDKKQPSNEAMLEHIRGTYLFSEVEEDVLRDLSNDLTWLSLEPGANLFRQGEASDSTYVVINGGLDVAIVKQDGTEQFVGEITHGNLVGEMGVFTGQSRTASIYAKKDSPVDLVRVPASSFGRLAAEHPSAVAKVGETIRQRLFRNQLAEMLPKLFGKLDEETFDYIESKAQWVVLSRGDVLMSQGDPGDSMYIVIRGRLQARIPDEDGNEVVVGEMTPGESVGEMSMFTGDARIANVVAMRDTALVKFSKESFDELIAKYPHVILAITNIVIGRLRRLALRKTPPLKVRNIAIVPVNPEVPVTQFTERLVAALSVHGAALHLSSRRVDDILAFPSISQAEAGNALNIKLTAWLDEQETAYGFVVYQADSELTSWTKRAVRQADRILFVGQAGDDPTVNRFEGSANDLAKVRKDLVLLHPDGRKLPKGTIEWLKRRTVTKHHHIRWNLDGDFERLARFIAGKAIGLCLGGGGARGFAHFGVIRTMQEAGMPIDIIGGNSMGAYISGAYVTEYSRTSDYSKGLNLKTMINATKKVFSRWHFHLTPPITSIFADGILVHDIKAMVGPEQQMEDLWIPFFCVSSNLSRAEVKTHTVGPLWRSIRVSGGLPAIMPPLVFDGDLHADGALLNNLPIDVMSAMCDGGIVIGIDVSPIVDMGENEPYGDTLSGFDIILSKLNPFAEKIKVPTLPTIMQRSAEIGAVLQLKGIVEKLTDLYISMPVESFDILGFGEADKIVQVGYAEAQKTMVPWLLKREEEALAAAKK